MIVSGLVNKILSLRVWIPLSRLTYCAYLLNPFLINSIYLASESAMHVNFLPNVCVALYFHRLSTSCFD